jgi:hypothetical protein
MSSFSASDAFVVFGCVALLAGLLIGSALGCAKLLVRTTPMLFVAGRRPAVKVVNTLSDLLRAALKRRQEKASKQEEILLPVEIDQRWAKFDAPAFERMGRVISI